ncbi:hypothetical protein [Roseibium sp.]|uniref:hypothetical protein n=1 Tax=Roseibium sp. TaxID=1936156 RepID=UPI003B50D828
MKNVVTTFDFTPVGFTHDFNLGSRNGVFYDLMREPYEGSREQRQQIRTLTSALIGKYVDATTLVENANGLGFDADSTGEIKILKQITRDYIISSPSLAAQQ